MPFKRSAATKAHFFRWVQGTLLRLLTLACYTVLQVQCLACSPVFPWVIDISGASGTVFSVVESSFSDLLHTQKTIQHSNEEGKRKKHNMSPFNFDLMLVVDLDENMSVPHLNSLQNLMVVKIAASLFYCYRTDVLENVAFLKIKPSLTPRDWKLLWLPQSTWTLRTLYQKNRL